jgi:hypothetical protein
LTSDLFYSSIRLWQKRAKHKNIILAFWKIILTVITQGSCHMKQVLLTKKANMQYGNKKVWLDCQDFYFSSSLQLDTWFYAFCKINALLKVQIFVKHYKDWSVCLCMCLCMDKQGQVAGRWRVLIFRERILGVLGVWELVHVKVIH